jgi:hypothetical protein
MNGWGRTSRICMIFSIELCCRPATPRTRPVSDVGSGDYSSIALSAASGFSDFASCKCSGERWA